MINDDLGNNMHVRNPARSRPAFTPGYGVDRKAVAYMLPWEEATKRLEAARNYWIVTMDEAKPHAAPVWGLWLDEAFYFSTDPASRKGRNFSRNPEIVVHLESGDEAVILEGTVEKVEDGKSFNFGRFADAYEAKYGFRPEPLPEYGFYRLRLRKAFAWMEKDFPNTATRWTFQ